MIILEHNFEGPFGSGCYDVKFSNGKVFRVSGKHASMISLILSGYRMREDFKPLDAFTLEELSDDKPVEAVGEVPPAPALPPGHPRYRGVR